MNVAFPALLIFVLVLPGIILRHTYTRGFWRWNSPTSASPLADEIAYGVVFALGLHLLWGFITAKISRVDIDPQSILVLLTGSYGHEDKFFGPTIASVSEHPRTIVFYLLSLYLLAATMGYSAHYLVRGLKLDRSHPLLRFKNEWYYLLSAEVLEFKENQIRFPSVDAREVLVYLSAVVEYADGSQLYRGIVTEFWFDRAGNLDKIQLEGAERRKLSDDRKKASGRGGEADLSDDRYYPIEGDYFVLRYSETKTMNFDYFTLEG